MIKRIAHIGIAVKKTEDSAKIFSQIFVGIHENQSKMMHK